MIFADLLQKLINKQNLSYSEMLDVMRLIMTGQMTDAQIAGFLIALRIKGETIDEMTAAASVMRELVIPVSVKAKKHLVDTCGTGGDGAHIFNVSTASAFVVAAAGGKVAKHGSRSVSGKSGSADILEALGVNLKLDAEQVARCIDEVGVGFMFAPQHHIAMKYAMGPRKELGVRTLFNLLGPMTNPAFAPHQVIGVYDEAWLIPVAEVLKALGSQHVLVVHSKDGLDEISIAHETSIVELKENEIKTFTFNPQEVGIQLQSLELLKINTVEDSIALLKMALSSKKVTSAQGQAARDIVMLNAGAAIYAADLSLSLKEGIAMAEDAIVSGLAKIKLEQLIDFTAVFHEIKRAM